MENPDGIFGLNQQREGNLVIVNLFQNKGLHKKNGRFDDKSIRNESFTKLNSKRKNSTISGWRSELLEKRGERCKLDPTRKVCSSLDRRKSSQREYCIPVELKSTQQRKSISCLIQTKENTAVKLR